MAFWRAIFGERGKEVLIVDISSSSVATAIVSFFGEKARIRYFKREEIKFHEDLNYRRFLRDTSDCLRELLQKLAKSYRLPRHLEIHCFLASPWFVSEARKVIYNSDKSFRVTKEFIEKLSRAEIERFKTEELAKNKGKLSPEGVLIETKITNIALNGYETSRPIGKSAKSISLSIFASISSANVRDLFSKTVSTELHRNNIFFHTLPVVALFGIQALFDPPERFVFMDINGEISDVLTITDGAVSEMLSFPLGLNFIVRWLSKRLSSPVDHTFSILSLYFEKKLNPRQSDLVAKTLQYVGAEWLAGFTGTLEQSPFQYLLPRSLYLLADARLISFFNQLLSSPNLAKFIQSNQVFAIKPIQSAMFKNIEEIREKENWSADVFILFETIFLKNLLGYNRI